MQKFIWTIFLLFAWSSLHAEERRPTVLVSVAPHKFFVEKIAGDTVSILLMVPAGASAHTFEPTPKQMIAASEADIWFRLGESFETRALSALKSHRPTMMIVDMRDGVDMITTDPVLGHCCCNIDCQDLHIWLSARQAKIQAKTIASALSKRYPEYAEQYQKAFATFINELDALDKKIADLLRPMQQRTVLVSHPAYAYFSRDYGLAQLSIEFEGKDPTPRQMTNILNQARRLGLKTVFVQPQYNSKGARLFANELSAKVVMLDPYSEHYFDSMLEIADQFSLAGQ